MNPTIAIHRVDDIDARIEPHEWPFARDNAAEIAAHWRALVARKPAVFDGRVYLMERSELIEEDERRVLRGAHFETGFSAFMAWRDFGFPDANAPGARVRNCFSMGALRGSDGGFILAEMGAHTANGGRVYFPAGTPDREDVMGDRLDLRASVLRELEEETGLAPGEVELAPDWLLVDAGPRLACMKIARVDAPANEVARDLNARIARQADPELAGMRVARGHGDIDRDRMPDFIVAYLERMFATGE